jgi:Protein of unknown function (DUF2911)
VGHDGRDRAGPSSESQRVLNPDVNWSRDGRTLPEQVSHPDAWPDRPDRPKRAIFAAGQREKYRPLAASQAFYRTVHMSAAAAHTKAFRLRAPMLRPRIALIIAMAAGSLAAIPATARAQTTTPLDSAGFLIRLGADTLAVERVVTYADSITGDFVTRSPHTSRFIYTAHTTPAPDRMVTAYCMTHYRTGLTSSPVDVRVTADFASDSAHVIVQRKDSSHAMSYAAPRTTVPLLEPGFGLHEILIARALAAHGHAIPFAWVYVPDQVDTGSVMVGPRDDTVRITTPTDTIRATVDAKGRVLAMTDPGGTLQATVTRIPWPDLDRWASDFMDRDAHGKELGMLSTRDTVRATVGGATLTIDYSRPSKRGREIFGNIVPWNTVWRTGANWATSLVTSRDLRIAGTLVPAGSYTIFTIPAPTGWTLIVSRKTGEWGTEYDPSADLVRIPMTSSSSARPAERFTIAIVPRGPGGNATRGAATGALTMSWDTVAATVLLRGVGR